MTALFSPQPNAEPNAFERAPWFVASFKGTDHCFDFVNESFITQFGMRPYVGGTVRGLFPEIENQAYPEILDRVYRTGSRITLKASPIQTRHGLGGPLEDRLIDVNYVPTHDATGAVTGIYLEGLVSSPPLMHTLSRRAERGDLATLTDQEVLGLLLYQQSGESSAGEIAALLLRRFNGLGGVLAASRSDLDRIAPTETPQAFTRLQNSAAQHLKLVREVGRRVLREKIGRRTVLSSSALVRAFLSASLRHAPREEFHVLFLDRGLNLIADEVMWRGSISHVPVYSREVIRRALELSATSLILVHNHPSGSRLISHADREITAEITRAGHPLDIEIHDHLIVAGDTIVSFAAEGLLKDQRRARSGRPVSN